MKSAALTTLPRILPLAILLGFPVLADAIAAVAIFDDYIQCRDQARFGFPNGSLVCDPEARLLPKATAHLQAMLRDLERNVPCDCPPMECQRGDGRGDQFMALLMVLNEQRVEQDGGEPALREVAERIWEDAQMGSDKCANGILLVYIRDRRKMATYQGHGRFNLLSDQQLTDVHSLDFLTANGTGSVVPLGGDGSPALTQVRRATDDESFIGLSAIGLSIALALTFLVLVILLALLLAKCCRMCCPPRATRKGSKYYVNPMPSYKSIEPIYVVTPPGSEAFAAPPSFTSAYGTGTFGPPRPVMYGQPPLPPFVQHPRSRSATPTSTQRIRRTYAPSSTRTAQSIHSTPEPNKRDKVNRSATIGNGIGTFPTPEAGPSTSQQQQGQTPKKMSKASPTIQEAEQPHAQRHQVQPPPPPLHLHSTIAPQILPFLDPLRRQEVQTKEQFIG